MSHNIRQATLEEVKNIAKEAKELAEEVTSETNKRVTYFEKEAKEYARQKTLKDNPILCKFFK